MLKIPLSGSQSAAKAGEWQSKKGREGLWHKIGCIVAVLVTAIFDMVHTYRAREHS